MRAAEEAEDILGQSPTIVEIFVILEKQKSVLSVQDPYIVAAIMITLLREDLAFTDSIFKQWTVRKQEGYYTFSEFFQKHFGAGN